MMTELLLLLVIAILSYALIRQHRAQKLLIQKQKKRNREVRREALMERDQLLDALGDAFLLVNEISQIVFANAAARKLVKGRKLSGRTLMEAFLDDQLSVAIMKCIRTGKPMQERVILHSTFTPLGAASEQGISAWVIDAAPLDSMDNEILTRVVIRDVTTEYLSDQVRRDFVANASHELRTPMAIINGYLENLLDDGLIEDQELATKFLGTMRKHGQRIARLVEDMLVISKMESGESIALNRDDFLVMDCIRDVVDRLELMIEKQGAVISKIIMPDDLTLNADRFYWTQILFNLVENALKQNPANGLEIKIEAKAVDGGINISVSDNGVGIPSGDLPYIFKRFYRVEKDQVKSEIKGTGLGLSIVKRAVEAHGGEITATSQPGQRTCFMIRLPVNLDC
jgi:two-component system phosphate regulon sensor histidine kinase PhoR